MQALKSAYVAIVQVSQLDCDRYIYIYIYKEKCKTVVHEVLPRAATNRDQTFPDYGRHTGSQSKGGDLCEEAPAEERTVENLEFTVRHLGFMEKVYGFLGTLLCCQHKRRAPTVVCELLSHALTNSAQMFPSVARCTPPQHRW